jgi:hypothetical protein
VPSGPRDPCASADFTLRTLTVFGGAEAAALDCAEVSETSRHPRYDTKDAGHAEPYLYVLPPQSSDPWRCLERQRLPSSGVGLRRAVHVLKLAGVRRVMGGRSVEFDPNSTTNTVRGWLHVQNGGSSGHGSEARGTVTLGNGQFTYDVT